MLRARDYHEQNHLFLEMSSHAEQDNLNSCFSQQQEDEIQVSILDPFPVSSPLWYKRNAVSPMQTNSFRQITMLNLF